ncbi:MAG: CapA family protein [Brevinematales bacterium]|nr:CapA family protein [Brevinematales bacterium]
MFFRLVFLLLSIFFVNSCSGDDMVVVRLAFGGDLMLDRGVKRSVYRNFGGDYLGLVRNITNYMLGFDAFVVNLEGPISHRGKQIPKKYSFRFETNVVSMLKSSGISIVNLANNHIYDWGYEAFTDTINILSSNGIGFFGIADLSNSIGYIFVKSNYSNVLRIGFLGFSEFLKELKPTRKRPLGLSVIDEKSLVKTIPLFKSNVDFLVVSVHWGEEYKKTNNRFQEKLAKKFIDLGADIVIGHHPHVIQNYEIYKGKYMFYSLGNFIFDQRFSSDTMEAGVVEVEIIKYSTNLIVSNVNLRKFVQDPFTLELR